MALLAIKAGIIHDPHGIMTSWSSNDTLHSCDWEGVTCGARHQRITGLHLQSSQLTGTLSPYIGNLSFLVDLRIGDNNFMGTLPPEIGKLRRLQHLWLNNNSFHGELPSNLSACTRLAELMLNGNKFAGTIPPELGSLSMLQNFSLWHNNLTGTIPSTLGNLSSLVRLTLAENYLVGTIPNSIGLLKGLTYLSLESNELHGEVPPAIFNMSSLTVLSLSSNNLEGSLPSDLGTMLPKLQSFYIMQNGFVGSLHIPLLNSSQLEDFEVANNYFQGQVPLLNAATNLRRFIIYLNNLGTGQSDDLEFVSSLGNATMFEDLAIDLNNFSGILPETICNFSMLSTLTLNSNKITGKIPSCIQNLIYLQQFHAQDNLLFGPIPSNIGKLQNLGLFYLSDNQLSGSIPTSVGNMTQLFVLYLSRNNLQGQIPSSLGNCSNLQGLGLSQNNLSGNIPLQLLSLWTLSIALDLSLNSITGPLPTEIGNLKNLNQLYIEENMLSGDIPSSLGACLGLQELYMGGNRFEGSIPEELKTLKGLDELDLSRNNLSGDIPMFLGSMSLKLLNLSYNNFEGEVPIGGIFNNPTNFSILGNQRLCGGTPELKLPRCQLGKTTKRRKKHTRKLIVVTISVLSGITLSLISLSLLYVLYYKKKRQTPQISCNLENAYKNLSYQSLFKATNGFSSENIVGRGTFGVVYKGTLDEDQTNVAIKKFNLDRKGAFKSFIAECGALQNIRHRNLLKVITACSSIDNQGNDFKALVYEYMENGSLEDWLHSRRSINSMDVLRNLNIFQRFNIAIDVAFALEYLHLHSGTPIVHCDLKPSNVLLDDNMTAHVGDFGLVKFLSKSHVLSHGSHSSTIGIRGTIGYTPPEYGLGNEVSTQGDVYSFGILILELFTGKKPTHDIFKEGSSIHNYVKEALPNKVTNIVDHVLLEDLERDSNKEMKRHAQSSSAIENKNMMLEALISVLEIALVCSRENPQERSDMTDVTSKLSTIKNRLSELT